MFNKQFGQKDYLGIDRIDGRLQFTGKHDWGYFIRYCDCRAKLYLTKEELLALFKKTDFDLPLKEILWERFVRWLRVPKISWVVEWRRLEQLSKMPLGKIEKMAALKRSGWTLQKIGDKFGLTRQRIHQLLKT